MSDQYKTQKNRNEAVNDCLAALKFVPGWFVDNALQANDVIVFYNEGFNKVTFIACQIHIPAADLDRIKLNNDNNFYEDNHDTSIHVRLLAWRSNFKKRKALEKR